MPKIKPYGTLEGVYPMPVDSLLLSEVLPVLVGVNDSSQYGAFLTITVSGVFKDGVRVNDTKSSIEGTMKPDGSWSISVREQYAHPHAHYNGVGIAELISRVQELTGVSNSIQFQVITKGVNSRQDQWYRTMDCLSLHCNDVEVTVYDHTGTEPVQATALGVAIREFFTMSENDTEMEVYEYLVKYLEDDNVDTNVEDVLDASPLSTYIWSACEGYYVSSVIELVDDLAADITRSFKDFIPATNLAAFSLAGGDLESQAGIEFDFDSGCDAKEEEVDCDEPWEEPWLDNESELEEEIEFNAFGQEIRKVSDYELQEDEDRYEGR